MKTVKDFSKYLPVLSRTALFSNIPEDHYPDLFRYLSASVCSYEKGEFIQHLAEPLRHSGIVLEGTVEGSFLNEEANKINMNQFTPGRSFGEALAVTRTMHSPIQLTAQTDCVVLLLQLDLVLGNTDSLCDYELILTKNLIRILASQNVFSNLKLRIANQKSLRDRILMYLYSLVPNKNGDLVIQFTQTALAEFLGVNRSALSRELGRMQDEGILTVQGKVYHLNI